jgi:hypothetical protein
MLPRKASRSQLLASSGHRNSHVDRAHRAISNRYSTAITRNSCSGWRHEIHVELNQSFVFQRPQVVFHVRAEKRLSPSPINFYRSYGEKAGLRKWRRELQNTSHCDKLFGLSYVAVELQEKYRFTFSLEKIESKDWGMRAGTA